MAESLGVTIPGNSGSIADLASLMIDRPSYILESYAFGVDNALDERTTSLNIENTSCYICQIYTKTSLTSSLAHFITCTCIVPNNATIVLPYGGYVAAPVIHLAFANGVVSLTCSPRPTATTWNPLYGNASVIITPID